MNGILQRSHPDTHQSRVTRIGGGLVRVVCDECDYVGIDLAPEPTPAVQIAFVGSDASGDPWAG